MNIQAMMKQAQKLQKEMTETKSKIDSMEFIGKSSAVSVTVNGKKSTSFGSFPATTVDKITVSLYLTNTAPLACLANSPTSTLRFLP